MTSDEYKVFRRVDKSQLRDGALCLEEWHHLDRWHASRVKYRSSDHKYSYIDPRPRYDGQYDYAPAFELGYTVWMDITTDDTRYITAAEIMDVLSRDSSTEAALAVKMIEWAISEVKGARNGNAFS